MTHHGEFKVTVTAVCHTKRDKKGKREGGRKGGFLLAVRVERQKKEIIEAKHLHLHPITQNAHHLHRNNTNMERFKRERDDK